ncbi:hypothetical protein ACLUW3_01165 [Limosilactobacillus reuteri subsp. suis]|uniref:hypothetical protein n=1 Tax=Limosilactobacillus reuteri TaxID=1598 RepID=UPI0039921299
MQTVRKERKILKKLIKFSNNGKQIVSFDELGIKDKFYLNELASKGLVTIVGTKQDDEGYYTECNHLTITDEGKHYFEKRFEVNKEMMFKSFWLPIGVAFSRTDRSYFEL